MDDKQILDLYWERSEAAISETSKKYGKYCRYIAFNILHNDEDSEECVNDTYLRAWNSIPPNRPSVLKTFLGKITRNLSLDRYELLNAKKRNGGQMPLVFDEIQECIPSLDSTENIVEEIALTDILNRFLSSLSLEQRKIFMRRYWYLSPIRESNIKPQKTSLKSSIRTVSSLFACSYDYNFSGHVFCYLNDRKHRRNTVFFVAPNPTISYITTG